MAEPSPQIIKAAEKLRRGLLRGDDRALRQMEHAYGAAWRRLRQDVNRLTKLIDTYQAEGRKAVLRVPGSKAKLGPMEYSVDMLRREARYHQLMFQMEQELVKFSRAAAAMVGDQQRRGLETGQDHAQFLMQESLGPVPGALRGRIVATWNKVPEAAFENLVGFLSDGSPLAYKFADLPAETVTGVKQALEAGFAAGRNPKRIAREVQKTFDGALTNAKVTCRTEYMRAYRTAAQETYRANSDVCDGWIWMCARQARTCFPAGTLVSGPQTLEATARHYTGELAIIRTAGGKELSVTPNHPILTDRGWVAAGLLQECDNVVCCADSEGACGALGIDNHQAPAKIEEVFESLGMISVEMPVAAPDFHGDGIGSNVYVVRSHRLLLDDLNTAFSEPGGQPLFGGRDVDRIPFSLPASGDAGGNIDRLDALPVSISEQHRALSEGLLAQMEELPLVAAAPWGAGTVQASLDRCPADSERLSYDILGLTGQIPASDDLLIEPESSVTLLDVGMGLHGIGLPLGAQQATVSEDGDESFRADTESGSYLLRRLAGQVSLDRIVHTGIRSFSGHVYNLHTIGHWYTANGIVAHNCSACLGMDGTFHTLDERLVDHPGGRCTQLPSTKTYAQILGRDTPGVKETSVQPWDSAEWFKKMSPADQRRVLGPVRYQLWKDGKVNLRDCATRKVSSVWGDHYRPTSVKELIASGKITAEDARAARASNKPGAKGRLTKPYQPPAAWRVAVTREQSLLMRDTAQYFGMELAEYKSEAKRKVKQILAEGEPCVQLRHKNLKGVLAAGRFKNQFETGTSGGALSASLRTQVEQNVFGVVATTPAKERPIYGFWGSKASDECHQVRQYGNVTVRLKDSVRSRTTVTFGDSADMTDWGRRPTLMPMPPGRADLRVTAHGRASTPVQIPSLESVLAGDAGPGYIEAQYPSLNVADISEVVFHDNAGYNALKSELTKRGISCRRA